MKPPFRSLLTLLSLLVLNQVSDKRALHAAETDVRQVSATGIRHGILLCGNTTVLINEENEVVWEVAKPSRDGYVLANGNILFSASNVATEMNRSGQTVWTYALDPINMLMGSSA